MKLELHAMIRVYDNVSPFELKTEPEYKDS